jgi:threonine/homoserine/homoserine lactone efflux protein
MGEIAAIAGFAVASGLLTMTPGIDTALVLRTAAVEGARTGRIAGLGIVSGLMLWGVATALGLGALVAVSETAYAILKIAGAAYLIFLGGRMLWSGLTGRAAGQDPAPGAQPQGNWFWRGVLSNLLNPKVGIFYVSFLPLFIPPGANAIAFSLLLAAIHAALTIAWFWLLTAATGSLARLFRLPTVRRWLDGITGTVLVAFGVGLALQKRTT